jgi:hypothetical protein
VLLALVYTLGITVDRLADGLCLLVNPKKILLKSKWVERKAEQAHSDVRIMVLSKEGNASAFLEYTRSRLRIMRATVFNIILIIVSALVFTFARCDSLGCVSKSKLALVTIGIGVVLGLVTFLALGMLEVTYDTRLAQAKRELWCNSS